MVHDCRGARAKKNHVPQEPTMTSVHSLVPAAAAAATADADADADAAAATTEAGMRRPRFLCLHGFRTSGDIMRKQVMEKWPDQVTSRLDLVFANAPFPAEGRSHVEGIFPPPYYEWFQYDKFFMRYGNFDECLAYVEDLMIKQGPFDGLMGLSQGAILSAALVALQEKGFALTRVPKVRFLVIIGGGMFRSPEMVEMVYWKKMACPSLHFIGNRDFLKSFGEALLKEFIEPIVIRHPKGHTIPRLDEKSLEVMMDFIRRIEYDLHGDEGTMKNNHSASNGKYKEEFQT